MKTEEAESQLPEVQKEKKKILIFFKLQLIFLFIALCSIEHIRMNARSQNKFMPFELMLTKKKEIRNSNYDYCAGNALMVFSLTCASVYVHVFDFSPLLGDYWQPIRV